MSVQTLFRKVGSWEMTIKVVLVIDRRYSESHSTDSLSCHGTGQRHDPTANPRNSGRPRRLRVPWNKLLKSQTWSYIRSIDWERERERARGGERLIDWVWVWRLTKNIVDIFFVPHAFFHLSGVALPMGPGDWWAHPTAKCRNLASWPAVPLSRLATEKHQWFYDLLVGFTSAMHWNH